MKLNNEELQEICKLNISLVTYIEVSQQEVRLAVSAYMWPMFHRFN